MRVDVEVAPTPTYDGTGSGDPLALLDWIDDVPSSAPLMGFGPISLDPTSTPKPRLPKAPPFAREEDLKPIADKSTAEQMLKSRGDDASQQAVAALDILTEVPEDQRGRVIDELDAKAFDNLLDRVPERDREQFAKLLERSQNPERKLKMWAEFHKSRATNDVERRKGDTGNKGSRTEAQKRALAEHKQRKSISKDTRAEVDIELQELLEKSKDATLSIEQVNDLIARKELEYEIEQEHTINLTAQEAPGANGERVFWDAPELQQVHAALDQIPKEHLDSPSKLREIERTATHGFNEWGIGGVHHSDSIEIKDWARGDKGFRHGGESRMVATKDQQQTHGSTVGKMEFVLTHEIGHEFAENNEAILDKFKAAAGWRTHDGHTAREAGVSQEDIAALDARRGRPLDGDEVHARGNIFSPAPAKDTYFSVEETAVPSARDSAPDVEGGDSWIYARTSPGEHFAEAYAKAIHVPQKLHFDLIEVPAQAAQEARARLAEKQHEIDAVDPSSADAEARLAQLFKQQASLRMEVASKEKSAQQRREQFNIIRNDVFGTDKAVSAATARMRANKVPKEKIRAFEEKAAVVSTPDQVLAIEEEVCP